MMRAAILVLLGGYLLSGCGADPAQQIVGHWSVDMSRTTLPPVPLPGVEEQIRTILSSIDVKFHSDGTAQFSAVMTVDGRWRFDGTSVVIVPNKPGLIQKLPLNFHELRFNMEPDLEHMRLLWPTAVGDAKVEFVKTG